MVPSSAQRGEESHPEPTDKAAPTSMEPPQTDAHREYGQLSMEILLLPVNSATDEQKQRFWDLVKRCAELQEVHVQGAPQFQPPTPLGSFSLTGLIITTTICAGVEGSGNINPGQAPPPQVVGATDKCEGQRRW